ncbi:protein Daple-like [Neolamprologus brichardi]|uniref:protein Daple-like n=1 Tax=Neolamprologus brichardi TaxID=32507 RepID=UPI001643E9BE|nr:protein Daple-like [Neolamprologus brichardi]
MAESPSISSDVVEENENLHQQVRELKDENENLQKNIELLLKEHGFSKNKKKRELQLENEKLCLENSDLNYRVDSLHCENQALTQQVQAKESAYEQNAQELKSALEKLKISEHSGKKFQKFLDQQSKSVEILLNKDLQEEEEHNRIKQQNNALEQEVQELTKKLADCQKEVRQKKQALEEEMHRKQKEYEMEKLALQLKVEDLQRENQAFRSQKDAATGSTCDLIQSFQNEKDKIKQQNNAYQKVKLTKKLTDCQKEVRQNEQAPQEEMQELDKGEPHQSSFELTPESNESTEKEERIKTSETTDLEEKNKDIPTESSSHMETPQEQTFQPRDVEEKDHGGWITWLRGAALYFAFSDYMYPLF